MGINGCFKKYVKRSTYIIAPIRGCLLSLIAFRVRRACPVGPVSSLQRNIVLRDEAEGLN